MVHFEGIELGENLGTFASNVSYCLGQGSLVPKPPTLARTGATALNNDVIRGVHGARDGNAGKFPALCVKRER